MLEFFGRFHPVFVHLPIGILLLACIFILLSFKTKFSFIKASVSIMLFFGALSAIISCVTGYLLANSGDYDGKLVSNHQWMGISVAIIAVFLWLIYEKVKSNVVLGTIAIFLILLIAITGHLGGSLTHGSDYLTAPLKSTTTKKGVAIPPIPNVQDAYVYQHAIQPLFKNRCYGCHGSEKQKGKLRLDKEEYILKGGESGNTIVKGQAEESELIRRLLLPLTHKDHMAPKEKPQLSSNEITLLKWWINNGADFKKKFNALPQPAAIKAVLASLQTGETVKEQIKANEIPTKGVAMVDQQTLQKFIDAGITVTPVTQNSNYLSANFINALVLDKEVLALIPLIEKQLLWLKLENSKVNDQTLYAIRNCNELRRLSLNYTKITDAGLANLKDMKMLQSLSLVNTKITLKGIRQLKQLRNLKYLYLYQTEITRAGQAALKSLFPEAYIDFGNYVIPFLPQDTVKLTK